MLNPRQFLRVSSYVSNPTTDICITHLQEIEFVINLWAVEAKYSATDFVTESDITPYLTENPMVCPSGGNIFADSYILSDVATRPLCQKVPAVHVLP